MNESAGHLDHRIELYDEYVSGHQGDVESAGNIADLEANILPYVPKDKAVHILDSGCGQGVLLGVLARHGYRHAVGIDISGQQIALAQQMGRKNVSVQDLFAHAAEHPGRYDVVVAVDVAEHFDRKDVIRLFRAWYSLIAPGGRLIIRTPNGVSPYSGRYLYSDLTHGVIYTERSLRQAANVVGFKHVRVLPSPPCGTGTKARFRRLVWWLCEAAIKLPLIAETGQLRGHIVTQNLIAVCDKDSKS